MRGAKGHRHFRMSRANLLREQAFGLLQLVPAFFGKSFSAAIDGNSLTSASPRQALFLGNLLGREALRDGRGILGEQAFGRMGRVGGHFADPPRRVRRPLSNGLSCHAEALRIREISGKTFVSIMRFLLICKESARLKANKLGCKADPTCMQSTISLPPGITERLAGICEKSIPKSAGQVP